MSDFKDGAFVRSAKIWMTCGYQLKKEVHKLFKKLKEMKMFEEIYKQLFENASLIQN